MAQEERVFTRKATGLVRELSVSHLVGFNLTNTTPGLGIMYITSSMFLFSGGSALLATIITFLGFVSLGLIYAMVVAAMPRSGGDYVFVSRTLSPPVGFVLNLTLTFWVLYFSGLFLDWVVTTGLNPLFSVMGSVLGLSGLTSLATTIVQPVWVIVIAIVMVLIVATLAYRSTRILMSVFNVVIGIAVLSSIVTLLYLLVSSHAAFVAGFNSFSQPFAHTSNYYGEILSLARRHGWNPSAQTGFAATWGIVPLASWTFLYIAAQAIAGGEVKRPQRSSFQAIYWTFGFVAGIVLIGLVGIGHSISNNFINAANFVAVNDPKDWLLPSSPSYNFLASLLSRNVVILLLMNIGYAAWNVAVVVMNYIWVPRYLLAAAVDGILPEKLGYVSERTHTPVVGILITAVGSLIMLVIYSQYATVLASLSALLGEIVGAYLLVSLAAIIFPYTRRTRHIYETSPIRRDVAGVPLITILGTISFLFTGAVGLTFALNADYGVNAPSSLIGVVAVPVAALLIYLVSFLVHRARGSDLGLAFRELPPE